MQSAALAGDAAILRGFAARVVAVALAEHVPGGLEGLAFRLGLDGNGRERLFEAYDVLEKAADVWWSAHQAAASANGNAETGGPGLVAPSPADEWMSTNEAAEALRVTTSRVRQLARAGDLAAHHLGKRRVFARRDVLALRELRDTAA